MRISTITSRGFSRYPTTLAALAAEQVAGRLRIAPACIWSGGEHLAHAVRARIEEAFRSTLVNEYGASECVNIACSCAFGTLHVNADWVILEPVDGDYRPVRPGERSHTVLLTNLANRVQPIIRYDLGDSITMDGIGCRCGSPLPAISVEGRHDDVLALRTAAGSCVQVSPLALTTVVEDVLACRRFQLVQTAPARIAVRIETIDPGERRSQWGAARRALRSYLAQQSLDNVRLVLDTRLPVPDARSGKLREVLQASVTNKRNNHTTDPDTGEAVEVMDLPSVEAHALASYAQSLQKSSAGLRCRHDARRRTGEARPHGHPPARS